MPCLDTLGPTPKILIIRPDAIGDVVMMIPLLNSLKATWPESKIYPLLQPYTRDVLENHPAVTEVLTRGNSFFECVRYLKSFHFDVVFIPYLEDFYVFACFFAGIPIRIGDGNKPLLRPFLTHPITLYFRDLSVHETERHLELFTPLHSHPVVVHTHRVTLTKTPEALPTDAPLIGIHTSTGGSNRAWSEGSFASLIDLIHTQSPYQVVLTGATAKECEKVTRIIALCTTKPLNMAGKTTLSELKTLISRCAAFIGTDTGPVHLASSLGRPVICLSPTKYIKALRWGPWQTPHRIVGHPETCRWVCNPFVCKRPDCLEAISAKEVFSELKNLLENPRLASIEEDKRHWFKASVTIAFYLTDSAHIPIFERYRHLLENSGRKVSVYRFDTPLWSVVSILIFLCTHDISVVHLLPRRYQWIWNGFFRQLSALRLYCPPIIVSFTDAYTTQEDLIDRYLSAFKENTRTLKPTLPLPR